MERGIFVAIAILVFCLTIFHPSIISQEITGLTTLNTTNSTEPTTTEENITTETQDIITLTLKAEKFAQNTEPEGTISLYLENNIPTTQTIKITVDSTYEKTLTDALTQMSHTYTELLGDTTGSNPKDSKKITSSSDLAFQIPRFSDIDSVTLNIEAENAEEPTIDFGGEGLTDWFYTGTFTNYTTDYTISSDFDSSTEGTGYIQSDNYYCEFVTLPKAKDFTISANYTQLSANGDLRAAILSAPTGQPTSGWQGGSDSCDLPETQGSCEIELAYAIEGQYLVCIYSTDTDDEEEQLYEIPTDTSNETTTAFTCPKTEDSLCSKTYNVNFPIFVQSATYDTKANGTLVIDDWETSPDAILTAVKYYVGTEPYAGVCKTSTCYVPLLIEFTSGSLNFSGLDVVYEYNGIQQSTSTYYDLTTETSEINTINSQSLDGTTIELDLDIFNISLPTIKDYTITVEFLGNSTSTTFSVLDAAEILDASTLITNALADFETFLNQANDEYYVAYMLDLTQSMQTKESQLESYQNQIGFLDEDTLLAQVESTLDSMPESITFSGEVTETQITDLYEFPSSLDTDEIKEMQNDVTVQGTIKEVTVEYYNSETEIYTLIKKEIKPKKSLEEASLYEVSERELLASQRGVPESYGLSYSIGTFDEQKDYYFMTTEEASIEEFTTIVTYEESDEEIVIEESYCGDYTCDWDETSDSCPQDCEEESSNMLVYIIIGVIVLIAIIVVVVLNLPKKSVKPLPARPVRKPVKKVAKKPVKKPTTSGPQPLFKK
tara:strand:+ start:3092 stop:5422 length:2331 start_codon:yes stop_codon:yes gene_type:complete